MDKLRGPNGSKRSRQIHFPGTVDATRPHVVLNGEDLHNIQLDVTPQELREQFAPNAFTLRKMKHSQRLRARLRKANNRLSEFDKNKQAALDEKGDEQDKFFPIYADRAGSFQADICFMPKNQVFNGYHWRDCVFDFYKQKDCMGSCVSCTTRCYDRTQEKTE